MPAIFCGKVCRCPNRLSVSEPPNFYPVLDDSIGSVWIAHTESLGG